MSKNLEGKTDGFFRYVWKNMGWRPKVYLGIFAAMIIPLSTGFELV